MYINISACCCYVVELFDVTGHRPLIYCRVNVHFMYMDTIIALVELHSL